MPTPSLKEFAQAIPVCKQTSELAAVVETFRSSGCDAIVVVSEQQRPLGVINLRQVMPYLMSAVSLGKTPVAIGNALNVPMQPAIDFHKPISQLEPSIIEALTILPEKLSLKQFWVYLQQSGEPLPHYRGQGIGDRELKKEISSEKLNRSSKTSYPPPSYPGRRPKLGEWGDSQSSTPSSQHWALVDDEGKFLGLLNSWLLLRFLAPRPMATEAGEEACEPHQQASFKSLVQLLEQLPLPLRLQTGTGQVLAQNLTWRQQIGASPDLDYVIRTTATMSAPPTGGQSSALTPDGAMDERSSSRSEGYAPKRRATLRSRGSSSGAAPLLECPLAAQDRAKGCTMSPSNSSSSIATPKLRSPFAVEVVANEQYETSAQATVQRYCAIDTPRMAATVSQRQVVLSAPPMLETQEATKFWETPAPVLEMGKKSQERVFSFVKIPLSPLLFESERVEPGQNRPDHMASRFVIPPGVRPLQSSPYGVAARQGQTPQMPTPLDSPTSNLCLVLAQDKTEQQQVAKELAAKNADLVQLNRLKDEFLACISHELKTPLTAVLGLSTLLKDQALGPLNERQTRYARLIYQSGRQLMTVVNDILDLTRIETGQVELSLEPVQIQMICDRAYAQVRQLQPEKDQEDESTPETQFTLEIEPDLEMLVADELRLRQILVHLLSNAIKFTEAGGEIGLRVNRWEGWIAFTVWDTGIGIPPEKQHLIFQKFQQLETPLTRRFEGTGLGLVLSQGLARLHGGDISFISKYGAGSQFTLLLPPCPPLGRRKDGDIESWEDEEISESKLQPSPCPPLKAQKTQIPNPQSGTSQGKRNRLVLIVETVPRYLEGLTEQLTSLGHRVVIARSGTEAIEKARNLQPFAIFLNPLLPQLSGWDVLTLLKSDAQTLHIPVIVTATQAEKQQAYHNKADGFLSLPVEKKALSQSLAGLGEQKGKTKKALTILHLSPELDKIPSGSFELSCDLTDTLSFDHLELNYRILEADDLEQAELLARVWHPDVVLLNSAGIADPFAYLQQFSLHTALTSLPLVTLDHQTTEAANQVTRLSVYPCLAPDNSSKKAALLQVIQVAAGMSRKPSILVMDIPESMSRRGGEIPQYKIHPSGSPISKSSSLSSPESEGTEGAKGGKSAIATPLTSHSSWLQALIQYLQTAGFRSSLSGSWTEVFRQLQDQSVDLLLICLNDMSDSVALVQRLSSLAELQQLPPILVLDHRPDAESLDEAVMSVVDSNSELELRLRAVATQVLRGSSQSMTQLLDQVYQALAVSS